jgi:hypothetical protein
MDECPGYTDKKDRKLLVDKKTNEGIEIGKALRVGNQFTDSHLMKNKKDSRSLGKPAGLLDRTNKTIGKLKGSTFLVKKMTEDEQLDELSGRILAAYVKKAASEVQKLKNIKDPMNRKASDMVNIDKREAGIEKAKNKLDEVAPSDPKIEDWIKSNKERFVKEYGKEKGMKILYAKAWKMHGRSESGNSPATLTDYTGPGAAGWSTGRLDTGTL